MTVTKIQEGLRGASGWLDEHRWTQGKLTSGCDDGCLLWTITQSQIELQCTDQAFGWACLQVLDEALSTNLDYARCLQRAERKLGEEASDRLVVEEAMMLWNDRPGRTAQEIMCALNLAADLAVAEQVRHIPFNVVFCATDLSVALAA